uniref:Uncharacterized protein n=1 Tax=Arundo donax TaxID=35708 RepID=A0A0A8YD41_ARUDO
MLEHVKCINILVPMATNE